MFKNFDSRKCGMNFYCVCLGQATALSAFLQMNDLSSDEEDEDTLLVQGERDHYDTAFEKMREQKLRSRQVKAIEELAAAKKKVEDCRVKLGYAREQVKTM